MGGARSRYGEKCKRVLVGTLREIDHLELPGAEGRIILRWMFRNWDVEAWAGLIWLRIGTGGRHL
jgi:hypothetical protein